MAGEGGRTAVEHVRDIAQDFAELLGGADEGSTLVGRARVGGGRGTRKCDGGGRHGISYSGGKWCSWCQTRREWEDGMGEEVFKGGEGAGVDTVYETKERPLLCLQIQ